MGKFRGTLVVGTNSKEAHDGSFLANLVRLQGVEDDYNPTRGGGIERGRTRYKGKRAEV